MPPISTGHAPEGPMTLGELDNKMQEERQRTLRRLRVMLATLFVICAALLAVSFV